MSNWRVFKTKIELHPHPNAEKLEMGLAGNYPVVVQKGLYTTGDAIVFAPEKSVLSGPIKEAFEQYLVGKDKDRVKEIQLRGVPSSGIILADELLLAQCGKTVADLPEDEDLSDLLGISKYIPVVPSHLDGVAQPVPEWVRGIKHDCERFATYAARGEYVEGERVVVTEKLHGSQLNCAINVRTREVMVTTKNKMDEGLCIIETESNAYWRGIRNSGVVDTVINDYAPLNEHEGSELFSEGENEHVQVIGELIPCQGGYNYGQEKPTIRIFDVRVDGIPKAYDRVSSELRALWVPVVFDGPLVTEDVRRLCKGKELVSGKGLHIREGVVVQPYEERKASDSTRLKTKIINPDYKEDGSEFN